MCIAGFICQQPAMRIAGFICWQLAMRITGFICQQLAMRITGFICQQPAMHITGCIGRQTAMCITGPMCPLQPLMCNGICIFGQSCLLVQRIAKHKFLIYLKPLGYRWADCYVPVGTANKYLYSGIVAFFSPTTWATQPPHLLTNYPQHCWTHSSANRFGQVVTHHASNCCKLPTNISWRSARPLLPLTNLKPFLTLPAALMLVCQSFRQLTCWPLPPPMQNWMSSNRPSSSSTLCQWHVYPSFLLAISV